MEIEFLMEVMVTDEIWNTSIIILQAFGESKWLRWLYFPELAFLIPSKYMSFYKHYTWPVLLITFVTYNYVIQGFPSWITYIFSFLSYRLLIIVFMF